MTRQLIQGREVDAHWTVTEFLNNALEKPLPTTEQVLLNLATRDRMRAALLRQMEEFKVLLMPACGITAFEHRARRWKIDGGEIGLFHAMMPATPFNLLGLPAVVIPFGISSEGLPIGVQLVGRPYQEEQILDIAVQLENARGPFRHPPSVC